MLISMWIVKDWMKNYEMDAVITHGEQDVKGFRLFSSYEEVSQHFIYAGHMRHFFPSAASGHIVLMHRNDIIQIKNADFVQVINQLMACFEFYEAWNTRLMIAACSQTPEQDITDLCREVIGPVQVIDLKMNLVAFTRGYQIGEVNPIWDNYIQNKSLSLQLIKALKEDEFLKRYSAVNHMYRFLAPAASPYVYGIMDSLFDEAGGLIGQIIYAYDHEITEKDIHIARMVSFAFHSVRGRKWEDYNLDISASILQEGLDQGSISRDHLKRLQIIQGITDADTFILCSIYNPGKTADHLQDSVAQRIRRELDHGIVFPYKEYVLVCLKNDASLNRNLQCLIQDCKDLHMRIGKSYEIRDLSLIRHYFQQTVDSLLRGHGADQTLCDFRTIALETLMGAENNIYKRCCAHPAASALRGYDALHGSELTRTLHLFLKYNCSYLQTADMLHVHRNTVFSRIQKIRDLFQINLEDPDEREYLLVSLLVL